jgi:hypothetical protein
VSKKYLLLAYIVCFSVSLYAENCTHFPEGISKYRDEKGIEITVSVAKTAFNGSQDLAESEAWVDAKALLLKEPLFVENNKKLIGVIDSITCTEGTNVFTSVKVSKESIAQANELNRNVQKSIKDSPTPQPENLPNPTEVKTEFDKLIKNPTLKNF